MACALQCNGSGWIPRGDVESCFFLDNYTSGLYMQPCYLPFEKIPVMFQIVFWGTVVALSTLAYGCTRPEPTDEASSRRSGESKSPGSFTDIASESAAADM